MSPKSCASPRIARARVMYDDPAVPLAAIARFLKMSSATLASRRKDWGWPPRAGRRRAGGAADAGCAADAARVDSAAGDAAAQLETPAAPPEPPPPIDPAALAQRLEATLLKQLSLLDTQLARGKPDTALMERLARIMASLARSLAQLRLYQRGGNADAASVEVEKPEALDDLRDELARRLDRLRAGGAADGVDAGLQPGAV